jgi:hypothetical protein
MKQKTFYILNDGYEIFASWCDIAKKALKWNFNLTLIDKVKIEIPKNRFETETEFLEFLSAKALDKFNQKNGGKANENRNLHNRTNRN